MFVTLPDAVLIVIGFMLVVTALAIKYWSGKF